MIAPGTRLLVTDAGEGWFALAPGDGLSGTVVHVVTFPAPHAPAYVIRLDQILETQERSAKTPSGICLRLIDHLAVRSRHAGFPIGSQSSVSCLVWALDSAGLLPTSAEDLAANPAAVWASCSVLPSSP